MQNEGLRTTIQTMLFEGKNDEEIVMKAVEKAFGFQTEPATRTEDMKKHIDFFIIKDGKRYGIDVKGVKRGNRNSTKDEEIHWIEFKNVRGDDGWLYGDAVCIAFMTNSSVLFVSRKKLADYAEEKKKGKELVYGTAPSDFYIPYQRKNRKDETIKVPTSDLRALAKYEIPL